MPRPKKLKRWTSDIDPATIPDQVLMSERGRRNALKVKHRPGSVVWAKHSTKIAGCRCQRCIDKRTRAQKRKK